MHGSRSRSLAVRKSGRLTSRPGRARAMHDPTILYVSVHTREIRFMCPCNLGKASFGDATCDFSFCEYIARRVLGILSRRMRAAQLRENDRFIEKDCANALRHNDQTDISAEDWLRYLNTAQICTDTERALRGTYRIYQRRILRVIMR